MNAFGVDIHGIETATLLEVGRLVYLVGYLAWVGWLIRSKGGFNSGSACLAPMLLALVFWATTTFPLQRNYGLEIGTDRLRNLSWCATAAAGNAPWESGIIGKAHLEPFWASLVSLLALRDPGAVRHIYPFLPALAIVLVALSLCFTFRNEEATVDERRPLYGRATMVSFFVLLASSQPLDYLRGELGWVGKYILLKPNHTVAFALVPLCVWVLAKPLTRGRLWLAVLLVALLGWAFVIFWVVLCFGIVVYVVARVASHGVGTHERRILAVLLMASVLVAPNILYLKSNFPQAVGLKAGKQLPEDPHRSPWNEAPPRGASILGAVTFDLGLVFFLGVYGMWVTWRRRDRFDRIWLALGVGCYLGWTANAVLYWTARARGATHLYLFLVLTVAVLAGVGAYDLIVRISRWIDRVAPSSWVTGGRLPAIAILLMLPLTLGWWWQPDRMDGHFRIALNPLDTRLIELGELLQTRTGGRSVICAQSDLSTWIPALSGRRIVSHPAYADHCASVYEADDDASKQAAATTMATHVLYDPEYQDLPRAHFDRHSRLEPVFDVGSVRMYAIRSQPEGSQER